MLREEFNKLVSEKMYDGKPFDIGDEEYKVIETVYCFHPSISETNGKEQVANLYIDFGFVIFLDMLPRARVIANIEHERVELNKKLEELNRQACLASFNNLSDVNEVLRDF